jgi:hypothetical protein
MAITQRFQRQIGVEAPPSNPSAGADSNELAHELEAFSSRRAAQLAEQTEERALIAGQEAGSQGAPANGSENTIAGRAFNRGALVAHQAAIQTDIRDSIGQFAIETPEDPDAFSAKVEGLTTGLLKEADPRMHAFVRQRVADYAGNAKLGIIENQQQRLRKESVVDLQRGAEGFFADATTAAFEGNPAMVEARRQELGNLLKEGVAGTLISEGDAAELSRKFEHEVVQQEVVGNFDRLVRTKGIDAGMAAIKTWQGTKATDVGITSDEHEQVTRQLISLQNRQESMLADEQRKRSAAQAAEYVTRKGRVDDAIKVLKEGFAPPQDQAKAISEDLRWLQSSGDPADQARARELAMDFDRAQAIQREVHTFRRMPDAARAQALDGLEAQLRTGGASAGQVQLLSALRTTSAAVDRDLKNDPRGFVNREGLIQDTPLDTSNPANFAASIQAREASTALGKQLTGQPLPRLTAAEAEQLADVYTGAEVEEKLAILGTITAGAGEDAVATLGQIDKKGNKQMALLGAMVMHGQGTVARDVMRGQLILAGDKAVKPKPTDMQADVEATIGAALGDWPDQRGQYIAAAEAKYAELKARSGDLSDVYDSRKMQEALNAVLPTAEFNGRRVAVPPGVSEDAFEDWADAWTVDQFQGVAGGDPEQLLELVRDRGRLVEVGFGQYGVAIDSAATGREKILVMQDGKPFRLAFPLGEAP